MRWNYHNVIFEIGFLNEKKIGNGIAKNDDDEGRGGRNGKCKHFAAPPCEKIKVLDTSGTRQEYYHLSRGFAIGECSGIRTWFWDFGEWG